MIRYALRCTRDHTFESWFRDSATFDRQQADGHVTCPVCGTAEVVKAMMAPAVRTRRTKAPVLPEPAARAIEPPAPVALVDERSQHLRTMMRALKDHLTANSKHVGPAFAEEARRMHEGETADAAIHGEASAEDVRSLLEDGIAVMPLPVFPEDRN